jgi:cadmium resistance transport/sequestration family protein
MFKTIITAVVMYAATAVDLLVILMLIFGRVKTRQERFQVYVGQYVGSIFLIGVSLIFAYILHFVPEAWMLGFLGLIPIGFGIKYLFFGDDDSEEVEETLDKKGTSHLISTVALLTVASCGADNIGLFVPYFVAVKPGQLVTTLVVFIICIYVLVVLAENFAKMPVVNKILERFGRWIMAIIYIALGVGIIIESGTIQHFFDL